MSRRRGSSAFQPRITMRRNVVFDVLLRNPPGRVLAITIAVAAVAAAIASVAMSITTANARDWRFPYGADWLSVRRKGALYYSKNNALLAIPVAQFQSGGQPPHFGLFPADFIIKSAATAQNRTPVPEKEAKSSIQVIERMMRLLAALGHHSSPVNLKQLATETRLHPSTAHRILSVMVEHRLVDRIEPAPTGSRHGLELGSLVRSRISVRQEALHHMQTLHEELGETINLSVRHDDEVVYIERASDNNSMMRVVQIIGSARSAAHHRGRQAVSAEEGPERSADHARRTGLPKFTDNTLTDSIRSGTGRRYADWDMLDNEEAERRLLHAQASITTKASSWRTFRVRTVGSSQPRMGGPGAQTAETISRAIGYQAGDR